jgi:hypothetical protein
VNEGCKEIKKHHIPIDSGFIFTCVKNKILDVVRRMGTAANRTLSYAVRNRTYCAVLKPEGDPEDTFDYQTTKKRFHNVKKKCVNEKLFVFAWMNNDNKLEVNVIVKLLPLDMKEIVMPILLRSCIYRLAMLRGCFKRSRKEPKGESWIFTLLSKSVKKLIFNNKLIYSL